jgi:hypothetical protein
LSRGLHKTIPSSLRECSSRFCLLCRDIDRILRTGVPARNGGRTVRPNDRSSPALVAGVPHSPQGRNAAAVAPGARRSGTVPPPFITRTALGIERYICSGSFGSYSRCRRQSGISASTSFARRVSDSCQPR